MGAGLPTTATALPCTSQPRQRPPPGRPGGRHSGEGSRATPLAGPAGDGGAGGAAGRRRCRGRVADRGRGVRPQDRGRRHHTRRGHARLGRDPCRGLGGDAQGAVQRPRSGAPAPQTPEGEPGAAELDRPQRRAGIERARLSRAAQRAHRRTDVPALDGAGGRAGEAHDLRRPSPLRERGAEMHRPPQRDGAGEDPRWGTGARGPHPHRHRGGDRLARRPPRRRPDRRLPGEPRRGRLGADALAALHADPQLQPQPPRHRHGRGHARSSRRLRPGAADQGTGKAPGSRCAAEHARRPQRRRSERHRSDRRVAAQQARRGAPVGLPRLPQRHARRADVLHEPAADTPGLPPDIRHHGGRGRHRRRRKRPQRAAEADDRAPRPDAAIAALGDQRDRHLGHARLAGGHRLRRRRQRLPAVRERRARGLRGRPDRDRRAGLRPLLHLQRAHARLRRLPQRAIGQPDRGHLATRRRRRPRASSRPP